MQRLRFRLQPGTEPSALRLIETAQAALRPPPALTYSEWADQERWLSPEASTGLQKWRTRPYQREPMDALALPGVEGVVVIWCSQDGKTEMTLNVIGYHVQHDPAPILYMAESIEKVKAYSKDRVTPLFRDTPSIRDRIKSARQRDSGNTVLHKQFVGGHLTMVGASSPAALSSRPIRILLTDEFAGYPRSAGKEGDPLDLVDARTVAFWNARKLYITSPRLKGDRSEQLWKRSDQRLWFVPCPDCGVYQDLKWAQVYWDKDEKTGEHLPESAVYVCEHCGVTWSDAQRWRAIRKGEWRPTAKFRGLRGYRKGAIAALGRRLKAIVQRWIAAQGNPEQLKVFGNTILAEWSGDEEELPDTNALAKRRESWFEVVGGGEVPRGVAVLTIGVDAAKDRLEYEIVGWGRGEESWSLRYDRILGDPRRNPSVLQDLDRILLQSFRLSTGAPIWIRAAGVDTSAFSQTMYAFCEPRLRRPLPNGFSQFVFALKGRSNEPNRPLWPPTTETRAPKRRRLAKTLWTIGVDAGKDQILGRLSLLGEGAFLADGARSDGYSGSGPGVWHFPKDRALGWFDGLLAEKRVITYRKGRPVPGYDLVYPIRPNEPLDCRNYAYAALCGLQAPPCCLKLEEEVLLVEASIAAAIRSGAIREPVPAARVASSGAPALNLPPHPVRRRSRSRGYEA